MYHLLAGLKTPPTCIYHPHPAPHPYTHFWFTGEILIGLKYTHSVRYSLFQPRFLNSYVDDF